MIPPIAPVGPDPQSPTGRRSIKKFFVRGLLLLLPTVVTVGILLWGIRFLQKNVVGYVANIITWLLGLLAPEAHKAHSPWLIFPSQVLAWVFGLGLVVLLGVVVGSFLGRRLWNAIERSLSRLPVMRLIYPFVKQITDFFFTKQDVGFNQVVAIEYPRKGLSSLGFVTGRTLPEIDRLLGCPCLSIFVPSSPTPMTGYIIFVPESDVVYLSISIEEAFRMIISGGVIKPDHPDRDPVAVSPTPTGSPAPGVPGP